MDNQILSRHSLSIQWTKQWTAFWPPSFLLLRALPFRRQRCGTALRRPFFQSFAFPTLGQSPSIPSTDPRSPIQPCFPPRFLPEAEAKCLASVQLSKDVVFNQSRVEKNQVSLTCSQGLPISLLEQHKRNPCPMW